MLKRTVNYIDFDGNAQTEEHYFNLSKSEMIDMEIEQGVDNYQKWLQTLIATKDYGGLIAEFRKIIQKTYGIKSVDGKRFEKSPEILANFISTAAYDALYVELATDVDKAAEFLVGVVPKDLQGDMQNAMVEEVAKHTPALPPPPPPTA